MYTVPAVILPLRTLPPATVDLLPSQQPHPLPIYFWKLFRVDVKRLYTAPNANRISVGPYLEDPMRCLKHSYPFTLTSNLNIFVIVHLSSPTVKPLPLEQFSSIFFTEVCISLILIIKNCRRSIYYNIIFRRGYVSRTFPHFFRYFFRPGSELGVVDTKSVVLTIRTSELAPEDISIWHSSIRKRDTSFLRHYQYPGKILRIWREWSLL